MAVVSTLMIQKKMVTWETFPASAASGTWGGKVAGDGPAAARRRRRLGGAPWGGDARDRSNTLCRVVSYQDGPVWSAPAPPPAPWSRPAPPRGRYGFAVVAAVIVTLVVGAAIGYPIGLLTRAGPASQSNVTSPASNAAGSSAVLARALYGQALAATRAAVGFHYVSVPTGDPVNQKTVGDAGANGGDQLITLNSSYGIEQFTLVLVSGVVYFQGNIPALEDQLGVAAVNTPSVAGKWVAVSSSDGPYHVIEPGITVADQATCIVLVPTSASRITTGDGRAASRIVGTVPMQRPCTVTATGHLDVATGSHLPISYVWTTTGGPSAVSYTTTFSGWGAAPVATAPGGAVAWTTLGATRPPGDYGSGGTGGGATPSPTLPA
jgi:hypothetical protein